MGEDAWSDVDISTEELAEQERQDAAKADKEKADDRTDDRPSHARSQGDRDKR